MIRIFVRVVDERHVARAQAFIFDDARERREMRIGDVWDDEPDETGPAASQRLGGALGRVTDLSNRPLDAFDHSGAGRRGAIDDRRHRRDRDAGSQGYVPNGRHRPRPFPASRNLIRSPLTAGSLSMKLETFRQAAKDELASSNPAN